MRTDISFQADGTTLRGWLYRPSGAQPAPIIVMAHGWAAVKEALLDLYGEAFAAAGFAVLIYDHRNFGTSDGEPRQEIDPWAQVRDYRHAITYAQSLDGVDPRRVGIWGTSFSGGHVLVVGALDRRVRCVVAQCPTISGHRNFLRRNPGDAVTAMRARFDADRRRRFSGGEPELFTQLPGLTLEGGDADDFGPRGNDAAEWYRRMRRDRLAHWRNELTLKSMENYAEYEPADYIARIGPTPLLLITGDADTATPTDEALEAYSRAREPKKLLILPGGHYDLYGPSREAATAAAVDWFKAHLPQVQ